jgi:hypothetical protein
MCQECGIAPRASRPIGVLALTSAGATAPALITVRSRRQNPEAIPCFYIRNASTGLWH